MHVLIISRTEPPLALGRLRARGELCELHTEDLRFTQEEITVFLNSLMGLHLSTSEITALDERTEGWVAGLQLAALSLQDRPDSAGFLATFHGSHRHVLEYLSSEVLARQSTEVRDFLLATSLFPRLCASLCDAVMQRQQSQEMLTRLEQANLFLIPLDEERRWYRYHHLFGEFLREQLALQTPERLPGLRLRAIVWYEEQGLMDEAIEQALAGGEFVEAERLLEQFGVELIKSGELMTLLNWLTRCSPAIVRRNPHLSALLAGVLGSIGQLDAAEAHTREAWIALQELKQKALTEPCDLARLRQLEGEVWTIRTYVVSANADVQGTIEVAQKALSFLAEDDAFMRSLVSASLGQAYFLAGDMPRSRDVFRETRRYSEMAHNLHALVLSVTCEGYMLMFRNQPYAAEELLRRALRLIGDTSERLVPAVSLAYTGLAALYYDWNHLDKALEYARRALDIGQHWGYMIMLGQAYSVQAQALYASGQPDQAIESFAEAEDLLQRYRSPKGLSWVESMRARLWLMQGNLESPQAWIEAGGFRVDDTLSYMTEYEHMVLARVLLARERYVEALAFLERLLTHAASEERYQNVTMMLLIKARALAGQGAREPALQALARALSQGEAAGAIRPFIDEGRTIFDLLKLALSRGYFPAYIRRLLAAFPAGEHSQVENELLSERERDVLRLLAAGYSNEQIARAFFITMSTVKTHVNKIYLKLGVHSRTQAIARAQELHLI